MLKTIRKYDPMTATCPVVEEELEVSEIKSFEVKRDKRDLYELFCKCAVACPEASLRADTLLRKTHRIVLAAATAGLADATFDLRSDRDKAYAKKMGAK